MFFNWNNTGTELTLLQKYLSSDLNVFTLQGDYCTWETWDAWDCPGIFVCPWKDLGNSLDYEKKIVSWI